MSVRELDKLVARHGLERGISLYLAKYDCRWPLARRLKMLLKSRRKAQTEAKP